MNERTRRVSAIAVACAIGVWLVSIVREPALTRSPSGSVDGLVLGTLVMACAIDALVAIRIVRRRTGPWDLGWLALRALLSAYLALLVTLPLYAIALLGLVGMRRLADADSMRPHEYRPISSGWFGDLTPLWWSRNVVGASQSGATLCQLCGAEELDHIHATSPAPEE